MENAVKALLIAAGVLLAMMLISLLLIGYNGISNHYQQQHELLEAEQLDKFNKQFQNYNGRDLRGNELISLMNKIIDYNVSQSYQEGTGYEPIKVTIEIGGPDITNQFKYELDGNSYGTDIVEDVITNTSGGGTSYSNDRKLVEITNTPASLISLAISEPASLKAYENSVITDIQLQELTSEISNIIFDENIVSTTTDVQKFRISENRRNRGIIIKNALKLNVTTDTLAEDIDILLDKEDYYAADEGQDKIEKIQQIVGQYYQYTQFKRAYFTCVEINHNVETGRVNEMNFKVKTKDVNGIQTVVFD